MGASKVLIMGGAGYIGSHVVRELLAHDIDCVVADNLVYGHREALPEDVPFFRADLLDPSSLAALFGHYDFDAVMHFAAFTYVGESVQDPRKYYRNNVVGTLNLLDAMVEHHVRKIVFSSTCAIYGNPCRLPLDETHPQAPINPYGWSKLMIEQALADYGRAYGLRYLALRYFNAAGAASDGSIGESHNPETHLIPLVMQAIRGERPCIRIFGTDYDTPDGTCLRDYIHVEDLASAHRLGLGRLDEFCGFLNLGTGRPLSVRELIAAAERVSGRSCPVEIGERRAGDPAALYAATGRAREELGWTPRRSLDDIVSTAWQWECSRRF
ncbi:UDP-glucose 4-epimerase GalE [uncultured Desulfovibrio sp.]|uniref:UDP-glucose 4-epimerase GalE n=1 Tax=uncultured Desulfovibrio sp. TaxID=167968 RepID=UPI00260D394F|nr:UDP-glucose 4-epimerase GalE [uncultured Desulfovibrio sp.]